MPCLLSSLLRERRSGPAELVFGSPEAARGPPGWGPISKAVRVCGRGAFGEIALPRKCLGEVGSHHSSVPAAAGSGWSEPWRRSPSPLAHRAKALPRQSLLSERRSGSAELVFGPQRPPEDLLGRDPSLKRSVSADAALSEKSPYLGSAWVRLGPTTRPYQRQRDRAGASLGGDHHHPSRNARKLLLSLSLISERRTDPA